MEIQRLAITGGPHYTDLVRWLKGNPCFPPLKIDVLDLPVEVRSGAGFAPDGRVRLSRGRKTFEFAVDCEPLASPKAIAAAADRIKRSSWGHAMHPLLVVPYLSESQLDFLQAEGVSGLDVCGNGVVIVPGRVLIYRTGHPNRFPQSSPIKNVYAGTSSIVARVFLLMPRFTSVSEVRDEILRRGGNVTLSTVSKVCARLEEDLVIARKRDRGRRSPTLRALQPDKLLDSLVENYTPPKVTRVITARCSIPEPQLSVKLLPDWASESGGRITRTGESSVGSYAVMARESVASFYCSDAASVLQSLGDDVQETNRFANIEFRETRDEFVYFDFDPIGLAASPIQVYLELMNGDKRDKETADQVRRFLLNRIATDS